MIVGDRVVVTTAPWVGALGTIENISGAYHTVRFDSSEHPDDVKELYPNEFKLVRKEGARMKASEAMMAILDEYNRAVKVFPRPFASPHEGLAIIEEEFLELRQAVFWGDGDVREEAIQLGAMALRFLVDCNPEKED